MLKNFYLQDNQNLLMKYRNANAFQDKDKDKDKAATGVVI